MFSNGAYAKVWEIKPTQSQKSKVIRISTSRKVADGQYEQDFSGFVRLVGKANQVDIKVGDSIQLVSVGVSTSYVKETQKQYTNFTCFELKVAENNKNNAAPTPSQGQAQPQGQPQGGYQQSQPQGGYQQPPMNNYQRNNYRPQGGYQQQPQQQAYEGFMNVPADDSSMPFN